MKRRNGLWKKDEEIEMFIVTFNNSGSVSSISSHITAPFVRSPSDLEKRAREMVDVLNC